MTPQPEKQFKEKTKSLEELFDYMFKRKEIGDIDTVIRIYNNFTDYEKRRFMFYYESSLN